jgi:hypothetical protein
MDTESYRELNIVVINTQESTLLIYCYVILRFIYFYFKQYGIPDYLNLRIHCIAYVA